MDVAIFHPSPKDIADYASESFFRLVTTESASASIQTVLQIPAGRLLLLYGLSFDLTGGGGQTVSSYGAYLVDRGAVNVFRATIGEFTGSGSVLRTAFPYIAGMPVPWQYDLLMVATFSAGVAVNRTDMSVTGYTVPVQGWRP